MTISQIIDKHKHELTSIQMSEKFGRKPNSYKKIAHNMGICLLDHHPEKTRRDRVKRIVANRTPQRGSKKKPDLFKNPEEPKKTKDYSKMRLVPLGYQNQYFYVPQEATAEEVSELKNDKIQRLLKSGQIKIS